jgi:hypothetical protein
MKTLLLFSIMTFSTQSLAHIKELPFNEMIKEKKVLMNKPMKANLYASFRGINGEGKQAERKIAMKGHTRSPALEQN